MYSFNKTVKLHRIEIRVGINVTTKVALDKPQGEKHASLFQL